MPYKTEDPKIERCVANLMDDPDFKPKKGESKKAAAIRVCKSSRSRSDELNKQLSK